MSNLANGVEQACEVSEGCEALDKLLQPKDRDLGGFSVRRLLPTRGKRMLGPWVFLDHMGPASFDPGEGINVAPHPHIGIATVTYLFEGEILHRDSLGNTQTIHPGDINLMVAGSGIAHSERERPEVTAIPHRLHGLQLWLALPQDKEEMSPEFYHYSDEEIPAVSLDGISIRVMMGHAFGISSPVKTFSETLYAEAYLQSGDTLTLPDAEDIGVYVAHGALKVRDTLIPEHSMAVFASPQGVQMTALETSRIAILGGDRLSPRHMEWNFVSSRKERIVQAKQDWQSGNFARVIGDEKDYIPLP